LKLYLYSGVQKTPLFYFRSCLFKYNLFTNINFLSSDFYDFTPWFFLNVIYFINHLAQVLDNSNEEVTQKIVTVHEEF